MHNELLLRVSDGVFAVCDGMEKHNCREEALRTALLFVLWADWDDGAPDFAMWHDEHGYGFAVPVGGGWSVFRSNPLVLDGVEQLDAPFYESDEPPAAVKAFEIGAPA